MTVPWRFIIGLATGGLMGVALFIGFLYSQLGIPTERSHYIFDLTQAKEQLAINRPGPRLLVVAGSSALFGINTELIERQTGCATLNDGTAVGLALEYRLYRLKKIVRPGDTILFAWEYEIYADRKDYETSDDYILSRDPEYFRQMSLLDKILMATRIPFKRLQKVWDNRRTTERVRPKSLQSPYNPFSATYYPLNKNGDEMYNGEAVRPDAEIVRDSISLVSSVLKEGILTDRTQGFEQLAGFIAWAHAHQITVLATFPNMVRQPAYDEPIARQTIARIAHFYSSQGVPVVGTAQEALLPVDDFFDNMYHLTHEEALLRTARLIPELEPYLGNSK